MANRLGTFGTLTASVVAGSVATGCTLVQSGEGDSNAWSTKQQSVLPRPEEPLTLAIPETYDMYQGPQLRAVAITMLREGVVSPSPLLRANAIESLQGDREAVVWAAALGLRDENRGVRFVAAMTIGKKGLVELVNQVEPLLYDGSESVRAAAIFAMRRCGRMVDPTPLSRMLRSDDPEVKANAAFILGELGDPSALPMLTETVEVRSARVPLPRAKVVELQIAEAMARLGDDAALDVIRAALFAPSEQGELTVLACLIAGRVRDYAYMSALLDKAMRSGPDEEPPEIRLAALQALAQIEPQSVLMPVGGGPAPVDVVEQYITSDRPEVRAQAAATLGWVRDPAVLPLLGALLDDPDPVVQIAAAGAILRIPA